MKISLFIIAIGFLFEIYNCKPVNDLNKNELNHVTLAYAELTKALESENGKTWNYSLQGPIMFVNRDTRTIIANQGDSAGELIAKGNFYIGKLPENINIANTSIEWNGIRWTMIGLPLPETKEERLNLLIHESFHRIQPMVGFDARIELPNKHLETKNGRIFLKLELEALKRALQSDKPDVHIQKALKFRKYRDQLFPDARESENSLELNEGLAEYTGSILSQRSDTDLKEHYISKIDWFSNLPSFYRSFPYATTAIYGYFLDKTNKKWNISIDKDSNITDILNKSWGISNDEISYVEIEKLGKDYNMESIVNEETQKETAKEEINNKYRSIFLSSQRLEINLENISIGFNPSNIMALDSLGTVYPNLRITDNWGILEVDSCGALISPEWNKVTISNPEFISDTLISGKGWRLKLDHQFKINRVNDGYSVMKKE